jgi:hypothetical protein
MNGRIRATAVAVALYVGVIVVLSLAGRAFGREPSAAWRCDDTRFTQLMPRGRAVVGASVSPPPGCAR